MVKLGKGNLSPAHRWILAGMLFFPLILIVGKWSALPTGEFLGQAVSLEDLPEQMHGRLQYVLFVPLGAMLVVLCRLTLGIRLLGPFRSILLGVCFHRTGIVPGILFLVVVTGTIVFVRPLLKSMRLPYFGRVSVILSLVSAIIIATIFMGEWLGSHSLRHVAYFPIVVLCLVGEGFARTLVKEGTRSALFRGATTTLVAVLLAWFSDMTVLRHLFMNYPELLIAQVGGIIAISEFLDLRLLSWVNPEVDDKEIEADGSKAEAFQT